MKKVFLILGLSLIIFFGYFWKSEKVEILNPLSNTEKVVKNETKVKVFGFLPTYMIGKTMNYTNQIDSLIFLGIEVDEKGNLIWDTQAKKINNETYLKQKDLIWQNGGKNILGIKLFKDEKIDSFLDSEMSQNNLIQQIKDLEINNRFDGINVDFEYQSNPRGVLSEKMNIFLERLRKENLGEISLDVFVNTINKGTDDEIVNMINNLDWLIIMAYDFHRPSSDFGGAVAPIRAPAGERNIMEVVDKFLSLEVNKKKIVMAYPLYGYEWKTYSKDFGSPVKSGWCQMISYKNSQELIKSQFQMSNVQLYWDELSMSPWLVFEEDGEIHQIYFENGRSLKIKLDLVKQNQFGGVGFWALGYEGENREVWDLVSGI